MLTVSNLHYDLPDRPLLTNINIHLDSGQLLHLKGANGAGKSTLMRIIAGLIDGYSGSVTIQSTLKRTSIAEDCDIILIGHKPGLSSLLSIRENYQTINPVQDHQFKTVIQAAGLELVADQLVGLLSAGQKRRAALLRLVLEPKSMWLLDEPYIALDAQSSSLLTEQIIKHKSLGGMIILTSHQDIPCCLVPDQELCLS